MAWDWRRGPGRGLGAALLTRRKAARLDVHDAQGAKDVPIGRHLGRKRRSARQQTVRSLSVCVCVCVCTQRELGCGLDQPFDGSQPQRVGVLRSPEGSRRRTVHTAGLPQTGCAQNAHRAACLRATHNQQGRHALPVN